SLVPTHAEWRDDGRTRGDRWNAELRFARLRGHGSKSFGLESRDADLRIFALRTERRAIDDDRATLGTGVLHRMLRLIHGDPQSKNRQPRGSTAYGVAQSVISLFSRAQ